MKDTIKYARGTVWWRNPQNTNSEPVAGVITENRPVVIISNNLRNRIMPSVLVIPLTTSSHKKNQLTCVPLFTGCDSYAVCSQLQIVPVWELDNYMGVISEEKMKEIELALEYELGFKLITDDNAYAPYYEPGEEVDNESPIEDNTLTDPIWLDNLSMKEQADFVTELNNIHKYGTPVSLQNFLDKWHFKSPEEAERARKYLISKGV